MQPRYAKQFIAQWTILITALLCVGLLISYTIYSGHARTEVREQARLLTQARVINANLGKQLESTDNVLTAVRDELAGMPEAARYHPDQIDRLIRLERALPGIRTFVITDAKGNARLSNRAELIGRNFSQRDYFERAQRNPDPKILFVSPPFKTVLDVWAISLTRAITGKNGEFSGVITATLDPEYFTTLMTSVRYAPDLRVVIVYGDGKIFRVVPEVAKLVGQNVAQPGSFFSRHIASGRIENVFAGATAAAAERRMLAIYTIRPAKVPMDVPLMVIISRDLDAVFEGWLFEARTYGGIFALMALLSSLALAGFQRRQRSQLATLELTDRLLNLERIHLAEAQHLAHIGSWELDLASDKLKWSDEIFQLFEIDKNQFAATYDAFLNIIHPDDRDAVNRAFADSLAKRQPYEISHRLLMADGRIKWVSERGVTDYGSDGKPTRSSGTVQDITVRKLAEDALRSSERKLQMLLDHAADAVFIANAQERWVYVNDQTVALLGYSREELYQMSIYDIVPPSSRELYRQEFQQLRQEAQVWTRELRLIHQDGHRVPVEMNAVLLPDGNVYGSCRDISERKRVEDELRIAAITFETREGILITDSKGTILRANHAFTRITGYSAEEAIGKTPAMLQSGRQDAEFYRKLWATMLQDRFWEGEVWNRRKNGEIYPEWLTITAVCRPDGKVTHYIAVFSDITERKAAEDQIHSLAFYDPLTQLPNRRLLQDRCEQALRTSARHKNHGAVLFLDLDRFKLINDTMGHDVGDLLLIEVAHRLLSSVRAEDTVARMGGDEFVVVLEDLSAQAQIAAEQAKGVAEKIRTALHSPYCLDGHTHHSSPSIGICLFKGHEKSINELFMHADKAMYQAKAAGRDTVCIFEQ